MKPLAILCAALAFAMGPAGSVLAQVEVPGPMTGAPAGPPPGAIIRPAQELDQLAGPIALYPDPLVAEILPAATQPGDIMAAGAFIRAGNNPSLIDSQPWDPSVKALARYPDLLRWMADNIAWTTQLGQAFLYQPADVMNAVQRLRAQAQSLGNLVTTPQQQVVVSNQIIEIVPANPEYIYIPVYQPSYVYYRRAIPGHFWVSFGVGFHAGIWLAHDFDWHNHTVFVWGYDHPRPRDWWYRPPGERFHPVGINVTVWRPHPGPVRFESHGDFHGDFHGGHGPVVPPHPMAHGPVPRQEYPHRGVPVRPHEEQHGDRREGEHR